VTRLFVSQSHVCGNLRKIATSVVPLTGSFPSVAGTNADVHIGRLTFPIRLSPPLSLRLLGLSVLAFIGATPLTALAQVNPEEPIVSSHELLMVGWMGAMVGYVEWLTNPLLLWSWIASYFNRLRALGHRPPSVATSLRRLRQLHASI
jgi:hypothetical protein